MLIVPILLFIVIHYFSTIIKPLWYLVVSIIELEPLLSVIISIVLAIVLLNVGRIFDSLKSFVDIYEKLLSFIITLIIGIASIVVAFKSNEIASTANYISEITLRSSTKPTLIIEVQIKNSATTNSYNLYNEEDTMKFVQKIKNITPTDNIYLIIRNINTERTKCLKTKVTIMVIPNSSKSISKEFCNNTSIDPGTTGKIDIDELINLIIPYKSNNLPISLEIQFLYTTPYSNGNYYDDYPKMLVTIQ